MIFLRWGTLFFSLVMFTSCQPKIGPAIVEGGVHFSVALPAAKRVSIAGSFNRWDKGRNRLRGPDTKGVWAVTMPLSPGQYEYRFVVNDNEWVLDPAAPSVDDGLGGRNSLVIVPPGK